VDQLTGHLQHNIFDNEGLVLTAYILCAFEFALLAGLLIRRSILAMIAAFIPWLVIWLVVEFVFRAHFMTPPMMAELDCAPPPRSAHHLAAAPARRLDCLISRPRRPGHRPPGGSRTRSRIKESQSCRGGRPYAPPCPTACCG
jgi:hypothetical protein